MPRPDARMQLIKEREAHAARTSRYEARIKQQNTPWDRNRELHGFSSAYRWDGNQKSKYVRPPSTHDLDVAKENVRKVEVAEKAAAPPPEVGKFGSTRDATRVGKNKAAGKRKRSL